MTPEQESFEIDPGYKLSPDEAYQREMGETAYERQVAEGKKRFRCCSGLKEVGHWPLCPSHPLNRLQKK